MDRPRGVGEVTLEVTMRGHHSFFFFFEEVIIRKAQLPDGV